MNPGILFALGTALALGAITTQAKLVYADGGNAFTLMAVRFFFSVLAIGIIAAAGRKPFAVERPLLRPVVLLGVVWSGSMVLYLTSVQTVSVSIAALLLYTYPLIVLLAALVRRQLQVTVGMVLLFLLAFGGISLTLLTGNMSFHPGGVLCAFLAGCGAAYTFVRGAEIAPQCDPVVLTFWVNVLGLVMIVPLVAGQFALPAGFEGMLLLAGATACYIVAVLCQFQALARLPAATAAFLLNLEPVVSVLLAALVLSEALTALQWVGASLVLAALFLSGKVRIARS